MKKIVFQLCFSLLIMLWLQPATAQYYTFLTTQAPYTELQGATTITSSFSASTYPVNIGSGVKVFDQLLGSTIQVGKNGFTVSTGPAHSFALDPFLAGLKQRDSTTLLSWMTDNSNPGNPVLKFQWKNMGLEGHPPGDFVNFQLWIYKGSQEVRLHYGPSLVTDSVAFETKKGPQVIITLLSKDFTQSYESHTLTGNPVSAVDDTDAASTGSLVGVPGNGAVYRFVKRPATGTDQADGSVSRVYPNPVTGQLWVESSEALNHILIWDINGRQMIHVNASGQRQHICTNQLAPGLYNLEVVTKSGRHQHTRLVKQ